MIDQALAAIVAAIITAIGTLIATNFEQIVQLLRKSPRNVTGDWLIVSERVSNKTEVGEYYLRLKQSGLKVKGEMTAIRVRESGKLHNHKWTGKVMGEYLMYECLGTDPGTFMISSGLLYIHPDGEGMDGYFVANRGFESPDPAWVGYTRLQRKR